MPGEQTILLERPGGNVVGIDSAYDVRPENRGRDVVVNASYSGVLPARFIGEQAPRAAIGVDCAIGPDGVGIAGLWYLEALGIAAATSAIATTTLGDSGDMYETATISRVNAIAEACGVAPGMSVRDAALILLEREPVPRSADEVTNRTVMHTAADGRQVICTDSIAFGLPEDRGRNVLCTAGHTGRSAVEYLLDVAPWGFICSDGGRGKDDSGVVGLWAAERAGLAGATVDARTARMGDGRSTFADGVISVCNELAAARGVVPGQRAGEAAIALLGNPSTETDHT